jgi:hypothetical protein
MLPGETIGQKAHRQQVAAEQPLLVKRPKPMMMMQLGLRGQSATEAATAAVKPIGQMFL